MPFGGYKGSGIALIVDMLCSLLSGASSTSHVEELYGRPYTPQNLGFCFMAINIAAFTDLEQFKQRMDRTICEIKASRRAAGVTEILIPGELERRYERCLRDSGIPVGAGVYAELLNLARKFAPELQPERLFEVE